MVEPLARLLALAAVEEKEITPETAAALDRARVRTDASLQNRDWLEFRCTCEIRSLYLVCPFLRNQNVCCLRRTPRAVGRRIDPAPTGGARRARRR